MASILSINTWKGEGEYKKRLQVLEKGINQINPSIIAIQEAFQATNSSYNTTAYLASKFGYQFATTKSREKIRKLGNDHLNSYSNVSILSRHPITSAYPVSLPSTNEDGGRDALAVKIKVENLDILIINVHLTHLRNGSVLRKHQLEHLLNQPYLYENVDAGFICGDFNSSLADPMFLTFFDTPYNIVDTFQFRKKKKALSFTLLTENNAVKIDHIFMMNLKDRKLPEIIDSMVVLSEIDPEIGVKASDHNGLLTNFYL